MVTRYDGGSVTVRLFTVTLVGTTARLVEVQAQTTPGMPCFLIVGLPGKAVNESRERIRSAFASIGLSLPRKRIVVNLAPANLPKDGSHYDLPIALGLLKLVGLLEGASLENYVAMGELSLDGGVVPTVGVLAAAITALEQGKSIICPRECAQEVIWSGLTRQGGRVLAPKRLMEVINHFRGTQLLDTPHQAPFALRNREREPFDMKDIKGQSDAKRALEIAAAGGHSLLMIGPPGVGKSMLARRIISILPPLEPRDILEVSLIQSVSGTLPPEGPSNIPPFRAPHHSTSVSALIGGGRLTQPGEVSLAHNGVLFLDELPEFPRHAIEGLRQPIETGEVTVARANMHVTYPARFQLIGAMNPCRCGWAQTAEKACSRVPACLREYQAKISGPLWDRFDMILPMRVPSGLEVSSPQKAESSGDILKRVLAARAAQKERWQVAQREGGSTGPMSYLNAHLEGAWLEQAVALTPEAKSFLDKTYEKFNMTLRGYHRILRVGRTLADLDGEARIDKRHIAQAVSYRSSSG